MLDYLVKGRTRRELFRLLWGLDTASSVSDLSRRARVTFSAAHRELEAMRVAGLARAERTSTELVYAAEKEHPQAELLRKLAQAPEQVSNEGHAEHDDDVRAWLAALGAPMSSPRPSNPPPDLEEALAEAFSLSHRDATVARVLPLVLWRQRDRLNLDRLVGEASRRDERSALGYFLELAGMFGGVPAFDQAARRLRDKRRTKARQFFARPLGPYAAAAARRNTPREALRWGYVMNMGLDSFGAMFDKFATMPR